MKQGLVAKILLVAATVVALTACHGTSIGAGFSVGGTGITASGTVTSLGSILVNGVEYQTGNATVTVNDSVATAAALKLGMVVRISGALDSGGTTGTATHIVYATDLTGPVITAPAVQPSGNQTFQVLNTTVIARPASTVFDNSQFATFGFDTIAPNDVVEISGFYDTNGRLYASRIKKISSVETSTPVLIKGTVSSYIGTNTFTVDGLTVNITATTDLSQLPNGITNGSYVAVKGTWSSTTPSSVAANKVLPEQFGLGSNVSTASVEGIITAYNGLSSFQLAGQTVDASAATISPQGFPLANGVQVDVQGPIVAGVLKAARVEGRSGAIELSAPVYSVNSAANSIQMHLDGTTVTLAVNSRTLWQDETTGTAPLSLTNVYPGNTLEIEGLADGVGGMIATAVKRTANAEPVPFTASVTAPLQSVNSSLHALTLLGVTYYTDSRTAFPGSDATTFFNTVKPGMPVHVEDQGNNGTATLVQLAN